MKTIKNQKKVYGPKTFNEGGTRYRITATVRHDDECGNGHNSFSITGNIDRWNGHRWTDDAAGCIHDEIAKHFPDLAPFIKWHLCSTDEPMHYIANTLYWLGWSGWCDGKTSSPPNLEYARSTAYRARYAGIVPCAGKSATARQRESEILQA